MPDAIVDATGDAPLVELVRRLRPLLAERGAVALVVPDPDGGVGLWPGERRPDGARQRSWRAWLDLAEGLGARLGTPVPAGDGRVLVRLQALPPEEPISDDAAEAPARSGPGAVETRAPTVDAAASARHGIDAAKARSRPGDAGDPMASDRYGRRAAFSRLRKLEHPGFLLPLLDALAFVRPPDGARVLVLGCHRGDEIAALGMLDPPPRGLRVTGVDLSHDALAEARARFPNATFVRHDANALPASLGRFALIVTIGLLQSPGVDDRRLLRRLVQEHAEPGGGLLLGLPNGRFRGGEALLGARTRNFREPDLSLLVKDLAAHRRYLHQHGYRTRIGGRYDLLLMARRS